MQKQRVCLQRVWCESFEGAIIKCDGQTRVIHLALGIDFRGQRPNKEGLLSQPTAAYQITKEV